MRRKMLLKRAFDGGSCAEAKISGMIAAMEENTCAN